VMNGTEFFVLGLAIPLLATAQPHETPPAFDVASVKLHSASNLLGTMMQELPGSLQYRKVNLIAVIRRAYGVETQQVVAPTWMSTEVYDIEAIITGYSGSPPATHAANLLAERFHLQVHRDKKQMIAYNLIVAKDGLKMHPSETGRLGYRPFSDGSSRHLRGKITLPILANNLSGILGRPVADQTRIDGLYDLDLNYADESSTQGLSNYPGIATALEEQLGLRLESKKALLDMIIVDHAEKIPTEN